MWRFWESWIKAMLAFEPPKHSGCEALGPEVVTEAHLVPSAKAWGLFSALVLSYQSIAKANVGGPWPSGCPCATEVCQCLPWASTPWWLEDSPVGNTKRNSSVELFVNVVSCGRDGNTEVLQGHILWSWEPEMGLAFNSPTCIFAKIRMERTDYALLPIVEP